MRYGSTNPIEPVARTPSTLGSSSHKPPGTSHRTPALPLAVNLTAQPSNPTSRSDQALDKNTRGDGEVELLIRERRFLLLLEASPFSVVERGLAEDSQWAGSFGNRGRITREFACTISEVSYAAGHHL
ncbi:hypothetical protein Droror1_Dr00000806 [Drosera rotundifolia]